MAAASGYFPDAQTSAQAAMKILYGHELGFSVGASLTGIHIIDGKPTMGAALMAAAVKRSPKYDYRVVEHTVDICRVAISELIGSEWVEQGVSEYTIDDAKQADLLGRGMRMWEKYPRNMLFARAISNAVAFYAPDVFEQRVYTPDELNPDIELNEGGEVIDVESIAVPVPPAEGEATPKQPSPATPATPRREPPERRARGRDDVKTVSDLLDYAEQTYEMDPSAVCFALGVDVVGEIVKNFRGVEGLKAALDRVDAAQPVPNVPEVEASMGPELTPDEAQALMREVDDTPDDS